MQSQIEHVKNKPEENDSFIARYKALNSEQVLRQIFSSLLLFHAEVIASLFQQQMPNCTMNNKIFFLYQGHYCIFHVQLQFRESLFSTKNHDTIT